MNTNQITGSRKYDDYGEKWFRDEVSFEDNLEEVWGGKWSVSSEVEGLQAVLLRRPGKEIEDIGDPDKWRWQDKMDPLRAREQHDRLADIYRKHGVEVFYVEDQRSDRPNSIYMRDNLLGTPEGMILCRQALSLRRGEEKAVSQALGRIGVPIIRTISGRGVFEGACALWVDRETIILGSGNRANAEGIRQVKEVLTSMGVENFLHFQISYGQPHLDAMINIVDRDKVLIFPWQTPHNIIEELKYRGYTIIEAPSIDEVKKGFAINFVALEPGLVLMPANNNVTRSVLEEKGVQVIEVDVSELMKGYGAIHCMTAFLARG